MRQFMLLPVAVVLLLVSTARGNVVWNFRGEGPGPLIRLDFSEFLPSVVIPTTATVDFILGVEGQTRTIYFNSFQYVSQPYTGQWTNTYLADDSFTELRELTRTITVDPITIRGARLGPYLLVGSSPYEFRIGNIYSNGVGTDNPISRMRLTARTSRQITGNLTVTGPTESLTAPFSFYTAPYAQTVSGISLSTKNFSESVNLSSVPFNVTLFRAPSEVFSATVDNYTFAVLCSGAYTSELSGSIQAKQTPEPAPLLLLAAFLISVVVCGCLRSLAKTQERN